MILRTNRKIKKSICTVNGKLLLNRYVLRAKTIEGKEKLKEIEGASAVYPLDIALGIAGLPFKITPAAMLEIAYTAIHAPSYEKTEEILRERKRYDISDDTIRAVTNYLGKIVCQYDSKNAESAMRKYKEGLPVLPKDKEGILYMIVDTFSLNTDGSDRNTSSAGETGIVQIYDSKNQEEYETAEGKSFVRVLESEWLSCPGQIQEFKWRWLDAALRFGYGRLPNTIIISDGAEWIRNVQQELFPDAQRILNFQCLKDTVAKYFQYIFPEDSQLAERQKTIVEFCGLLESGEWEIVLEKLKIYENRDSPYEALDLRKYIENNKDSIDYPLYRDRGYSVWHDSKRESYSNLRSYPTQADMRWESSHRMEIYALKDKADSNLWPTVQELLYNKLGVEK